MPAAASQGRARVYTIPAGRPFLKSLADALLRGEIAAPCAAAPSALELADTTLLMPSRGAVTALQTAFLEAGKGKALLLPRIKPIADTGTDLDVLTSAEDLAAAAATGSRRVIGQLERQLVLTELVAQWAVRARQTQAADGRGLAHTTPAQAVHMAKELALLMDLIESHDLDANQLGALVPEELSLHWKDTLEFLRIVTHFWPKHLEDNGVVSPVAHRQRILRTEISRIKDGRAGTVVLAGAASLDPAALELARAVLDCPTGVIVLPALDQSIDVATWKAIIPNHPEHPQFGLAKMLDALGIARGDVAVLPGAQLSVWQQARQRLASETMRPAETTEHWHAYVAKARKREMAEALSGVTLIEAATADEEAEVIALMLRSVAQTPSKTAALVTPDRMLARRVSVRLRAWDLKVPVSAGTPFSQTSSGTFLDLVIEAVANGFEPATVADLMKHPLFRAGLPEQEVRAATRALELAVFRQPYFGTGLEGIEKALERARGRIASDERLPRPVRLLSASDLEAAAALVDALSRAMRPLERLFLDPKEHALADLVRAHTNAALELAPAEGLYHGPAGEWVATFFAALMDKDQHAPAVLAADYADFYRSLVAEKSLHIDGAPHPRIRILDPFAARLQQPDFVILGALNEATWPSGAEPGPWLNRPMRAKLGLPAPEERIGAAAHDFSSLLCADEVVLSRAAKVDGTPTVPSRWLLRLEALRGGASVEVKETPWLQWAAARNAIANPAPPLQAPAPCPPLALRPRKLSATAAEKWFANPYALYAQAILKLEALPDLGHEPDAAMRGSIVHEALRRFAVAYPDALPDDIAGALIKFAEASLDEMTGSPRVAAFWVPRFARFAAWFAETEPMRRRGIARQLVEVNGAAVLDAPGGPFTLTARADRIDVLAGPKPAVTITDYKTGSDMASLARRAGQGIAPQLPLEAAIALAGGFAHVGNAKAPPAVHALRYISASGGEPAGQEVAVNTDDVTALALKVRQGLEALIREFDKPQTPYRAVRRAQFSYDYDAFAHLARVAEWSGDNASEEEG